MDQVDERPQPRGHEATAWVVEPQATERRAPRNQQRLQRAGREFFLDEPFGDEADAQAAFGPRERAGLYTFLELARDAGLLETVPELRFVQTTGAAVA